MLVELQKHIGARDCYCLPYPHLSDFYRAIGFELIEISEALYHLARRVETYISMGLEVILMKCTGGKSTAQ